MAEYNSTSPFPQNDYFLLLLSQLSASTACNPCWLRDAAELQPSFSGMWTEFIVDRQAAIFEGCPPLIATEELQSKAMQEEGETWEEAIARSSRPSSRSKRRRSSSGGPQRQTTAGDAIIAAGYPLQIQRVVSPDGYVMYMERIPRPGLPSAAATVRTGATFGQNTSNLSDRLCAQVCDCTAWWLACFTQWIGR